MGKELVEILRYLTRLLMWIYGSGFPKTTEWLVKMIEIRDQIMWIYGSGFPKSLNIGKLIDKKLVFKRDVIGK